MNKIKIAFIIDYLDVGGTESQIYALLQGLDKKQFHPVVICLKKKGEIAGKIEQSGIKVFLIKDYLNRAPKLIVRLLQTLKVSRILKKLQIDIVQNYLVTANIFGTIAARLARAPIICASERGVTNTDQLGDLADRNRILRWISPWIHNVWGNAEQVTDYLKDVVRIPDEKICCIYNGIYVENFKGSDSYDLRGELGLSPDIKLIGMIARLVPIKNHSLFFESVQIVRKRCENFCVILIGAGDLQSCLEKQVSKIGLKQIVHFLGNRTDVAKILPCLDIVVQSSNGEGLPNAIMEAMAARKPVVATNAGGTEELVMDRKTGFLVPVGNYALLAEKIILLLNDSGLGKTMGEAGYQHIKKNFSIEKMIQNVQDLYLNLVQLHGLK
jgi:glycosyltransferase involved in cell wall biosynthesis